MGPYIIYPDEHNRNRWIERLNIAAENRLTITTPIKELLITGAVILLCELLLVTFTSIYTCVFTIPILFFWTIPYAWYFKIWTCFHFARIYPIVLPLLVGIASLYLNFSLSRL